MKLINIFLIPFQLLWKIIFLLNFVISLILLYPFFYLLLMHERNYPKAFFLTKLWAYWLFLIPGVWISIKRKATKKELIEPCVYCSNHTSFLDIMYCYIIIPNYFVSIPKQELEKVPLFNILIKKLNIPLDRKSKVNSYKAFTIAGKYIDKGVSIFLFPEGTISKVAPKMGLFKNGAFKLAIEKQVPIVPITFQNNWKILQPGSFFKGHAHPGIAHAIIHSPIKTKGMTLDNLSSLREQVYSIIKTPLTTE